MEVKCSIPFFFLSILYNNEAYSSEMIEYVLLYLHLVFSQYHNNGDHNQQVYH